MKKLFIKIPEDLITSEFWRPKPNTSFKIFYLDKIKDIRIKISKMNFIEYTYQRTKFEYNRNTYIIDLTINEFNAMIHAVEFNDNLKSIIED